MLTWAYLVWVQPNQLGEVVTHTKSQCEKSRMQHEQTSKCFKKGTVR